MRCAVCNKESGENNYCWFHLKAYENVVVKYERWKRALDISWKGYLSEIAKNPLAGEWAREVAQHLMKSGEQIDVKKCQERRL